MAFTCRQASLLGALVVLLTLACMTSALEEHKFRKAEDTGFAIRNRALAKQVPSGYLQRAEVLANSVDAKSSEITFHVQVYERHRNGAADESRHALGAPVHVTLRAYSDAFVRATARPADESAQKRHEVRFVLDDGLEKRRTEFKQISREKDGELRASFGPQREVVVSFAPFRVTLRLAGNDEVVWNARDLFHFETSVRAPLTDAPADKEDEVMKDVRAQLGDRQEAESFGQYKDSKPNGPSSLGVDFALPRAKALYGLPERTIGLTLRPTTRYVLFVERYKQKFVLAR